jgi:hypothetical protein
MMWKHEDAGGLHGEGLEVHLPPLADQIFTNIPPACGIAGQKLVNRTQATTRGC